MFSVVQLHLLCYLLEDVARSHHCHLAQFRFGRQETQSVGQVGSLYPHALIAYAGDDELFPRFGLYAELSLGVAYGASSFAYVNLHEGERFARLSISYQGRIRLCSLCYKGKCGEQEACERPCEREDNVAKCISLHKVCSLCVTANILF